MPFAMRIHQFFQPPLPVQYYFQKSCSRLQLREEIPVFRRISDIDYILAAHVIGRNHGNYGT
jgi:hypothetical protein